jgi:hypothetical protein
VALSSIALVAATAAVLLPARSADALADPLSSAAPAPPSAGDTRSLLGTVEVDARRRREEMKPVVSQFVGSVITHVFDRSLARWHTPICPLVAGLPRERGEFVLARVSQNVTAAHAPLATEHCRANLFIVLADQADGLLTRWYARDRRMFDTSSGVGALQRFLATPRPVRVWYNASIRSDDGVPLTSDALPTSSMGLAAAGVNDYATNRIRLGSHLERGAVRALSSVIVVVDTSFLARVNMGQLADYVSMVALAEARLDAPTPPAPTILTLFRPTATAAPQALSAWDQALLKSLYTTDQSSVMQQTQMEVCMLDELAK